jgi:hypothetical protein
MSNFILKQFGETQNLKCCLLNLYGGYMSAFTVVLFLFSVYLKFFNLKNKISFHPNIMSHPHPCGNPQSVHHLKICFMNIYLPPYVCK